MGYQRDHPRLRGEHEFMFCPWCGQRGSPPPTRGTRLFDVYERKFKGITPAYAGNTRWLWLHRGLSRDHPRLRGEHLFSFILLGLNMGSPPPTRGTQFMGLTKSQPYGITPAYAGNTIKDKLSEFGIRDHPRLRGEHRSIDHLKQTLQGSPPPTRGTPWSHCCGPAFSGITPAYAGNTGFETSYNALMRDHPRLRGEHRINLYSLDMDLGSPPPTRGTPDVRKSDIIEVGITPAYAGNTCWMQ